MHHPMHHLHPPDLLQESTVQPPSTQLGVTMSNLFPTSVSPAPSGNASFLSGPSLRAFPWGHSSRVSSDIMVCFSNELVVHSYEQVPSPGCPHCADSITHIHLHTWVRAYACGHTELFAPSLMPSICQLNHQQSRAVNHFSAAGLY